MELGLAVLSPWAYSHVGVLRRYAKFVYNCGQYQQASSLLVSVRALTTDPDKARHARTLTPSPSPSPNPNPSPTLEHLDPSDAWA